MSATVEKLIDLRTLLLSSTTILLLAYWLIIHPFYVSPLAKIPAAHPSCHFSKIWIKWHRWRGTELNAIQLAFQKHGSYVRLAPKELAVNSKDGFDSVYGIGSKNMDKPKLYDYFINYDFRNMFTSLTAPEHKFRRGRIARVYSKPYVQQSKHVRAIIKTTIWGRLMPLIQQAVQTTGGGLDVLPLNHAIALDTVGAFVFGIAESYNTIEDMQLRKLWLDTFLTIFLSRSVTLLHEFKLFTTCLAGAGFRLIPDMYYESRDRNESWGSERVKSLEKQFQQGQRDPESFPDGDYPILFSAVRECVFKDAGIKEFMPLNARQFREVASECVDQIGPAGDTYGVAFSYILYKLSQNQEIQDSLRTELATVKGLTCFKPEQNITSVEVPVSTDLSRLPLLNGVIREGLRLRNSHPHMDPRITPAGRLSAIGPYDDIPSGVRVGAYTYLLHRKTELYDNPLEWNPFRWTERDINGKLLPFFAFSGGSRGCIGQHLSDEMMRQHLAAIYISFKTSVLDETNYPGDAGRMGGSGREKLLIKFEKLS